MTLCFAFRCLLLYFCTLLYCHNVLSDVTEYDEDAWKEAADFVLEGYKPHVKPCENFVEHACGRWKENHPQEVQWFAQQHHTNKRLDEAITAVDPDDNKTPQFKKIVQKFYFSCEQNEMTDASSPEAKKRMKTLYNGLASEIGTPPILSTNRSDKEKLLKENFWHLLGRIHRVLPESNVFFKVEGVIHKVDCLGNVPILQMLPVSDQKSDITGKDIVRDFKFLTNVLGIKREEKETKKKAEDIYHFQQAFEEYLNHSHVYKAEVKDEEGEDAGEINLDDALISLDDLTAYNPNISWVEYFQGLFTKEQYHLFNQSDPNIAVPEKRILNNIENIARRFDTETIFNYIFWKTLRRIFILANVSQEANAKSCLDITKETFSSATVRILADHFKLDLLELRYDMEMIASTVFSAFRFLLAGSDWLDADEKMALIRKIDGVSFYAGIPDWIMNDEEVLKRTDDLDNKGGRLLENILTSARNKFKKEIDLVVGINDANSEPEPSLEQNAYYLSMTINFWLGFILPPFYHPKYPLAAKYGFAGVFVGHELLHGFDANHVLEKPKSAKTWLKDSTLKVFYRKVDCVRKQYSSYCFKKNKKCINGRTTIGENMADIDGVKVAYMAYKFATLTNGAQPPLPGLTDLSNDALFFLFSARCRCSSGGELEWWLRNNDDGEPHAPDESRYVVPFRNFPIFAKTFSCSVNSDFDPTRICPLWGQYLGDKEVG